MSQGPRTDQWHAAVSPRGRPESHVPFCCARMKWFNERPMRERRTLVVSGGVALVALPYIVAAQPTNKVVRIGYLTYGTALSARNAQIEAFRQGLRDLGWVEGVNYVIEFRYGENRPERFPELAAELVQMNVDVIVAGTEPVISAAKRATRTIPIVMTAAADPVGAGLVDSLAHPGGNVTGVTLFAPDLAAKRLQLLREAMPGLSRVAILWNGDNPGKAREAQATQRAVEQLGMGFHPFEVHGPEPGLERAFSTIAAKAQAVIALGDTLMFVHRSQLQALAAKNRLPVIYEGRIFMDAGGLMSYGPDINDTNHRAAYYVDKIIKGAKPADLPIEQPTKIELVINLKAARALGMTIPQSLLLRADEVID